jgi:hypothetical protein
MEARHASCSLRSIVRLSFTKLSLKILEIRAAA